LSQYQYNLIAFLGICCPMCADPLFTAPHGQIVQIGASSYRIRFLFKQILNA